MKNILALTAALALAAASAHAQATPGAATPPAPATGRTPAQQAANQAQRLAKELGLTADQQSKVQQVLLTSRQEMLAARDQAQASGDRQGLGAAMKASRAKADDQLRTVLTPAQFARYQQIVAERIGQLRTRAGVGSR